MNFTKHPPTHVGSKSLQQIDRDQGKSHTNMPQKFRLQRKPRRHSYFLSRWMKHNWTCIFSSTLKFISVLEPTVSDMLRSHPYAAFLPILDVYFMLSQELNVISSLWIANATGGMEMYHFILYSERNSILAINGFRQTPSREGGLFTGRVMR